MVHKLTFARFIGLVKFLSEQRQAEAKEKMTIAAFTAWQMGAGVDKTFKEYMTYLGLADRQGGQAPRPAQSPSPQPVQSPQQPGAYRNFFASIGVKVKKEAHFTSARESKKWIDKETAA